MKSAIKDVSTAVHTERPTATRCESGSEPTTKPTARSYMRATVPTAKPTARKCVRYNAPTAKLTQIRFARAKEHTKKPTKRRLVSANAHPLARQQYQFQTVMSQTVCGCVYQKFHPICWRQNASRSSPNAASSSFN